MDLHYKQEATVGALVLVGALLFIGGTMWLGGKRISTRPTVAVQFSDAGTLKRGSPVRVSGVQLGMVDAIEFQGYGRVLVHLDLDEEVSPRRDAAAELATVGLVADAVINFNPGTAPEPLPEDAVIIGTVEPGFMDIGTRLGDQASTVLGGLTQLQFKEISEELRRTLTSFERLAQVYANTRSGPIADMTTTMKGLQVVSARIDSMLEAAQLDRTIRTADSMMVNLRTLSASVQSTAAQLDSVLVRVNRGEGTAGRFLTDTLLYQNTQRLVKSIQEFVDELKRNPGKLGLTIRIF
ncbi:MAG TPA: MlaD family protein [Gemmatimonadales bacterium]|nr:MlaD family protein [Gemmatimonadales bacterium]